MKLFGLKKEKSSTPSKEKGLESRPKASGKAKKAQKKGKVVSGAPKGSAHPLILKSPRITEKATELTANDVYTFNVAADANKQEVAKAIEQVYGVTPIRVNMVPVRGKRVSGRRGLGGKTAHGKKAYVFLKKGDSIDII